MDNDDKETSIDIKLGCGINVNLPYYKIIEHKSFDKDAFKLDKKDHYQNKLIFKPKKIDLNSEKSKIVRVGIESSDSSNSKMETLVMIQFYKCIEDNCKKCSYEKIDGKGLFEN